MTAPRRALGQGVPLSDRFAVGVAGAQSEHIQDLRQVMYRLLDAAIPTKPKETTG